LRLGSAERREQLGAGLARRVGPLTASKTAELPKGDRGKGGVPNGLGEHLPEGMRTVVSTRQGGSPYSAELRTHNE